jgi:hypothetical protein
LAIVIVGAAFLTRQGTVRGQAPPGPLPQVESKDTGPPAGKTQAAKPAIKPRTSIMGAWRLDPDESDDARKKMQDARRNGSNGGYGGNRRVGGGYPGGGGGYGGRRIGGQGESDEERQQMQELLSPPRLLTIAEAKKDVEIDTFDDQSHKRALFTDGRKLQKSKEPNYQEIAAHWEGTRLVTDEKGPRGGKMTRSFELSDDGTQMYETLHMTTGRSNTPLVIRYVYNQTGDASANGSPPSTAQPGKR